jgi:hypothetical protein
MARNDPRDEEKRTFSYDEAAALLPEVRRITEEAYLGIQELTRELPPDEEGRKDAQARADRIVGRWAMRLNELGVEVKGLWLADFDNGSGYYCWQYPEPGLHFYHSYEEGFRGRMRIH